MNDDENEEVSAGLIRSPGAGLGYPSSLFPVASKPPLTALAEERPDLAYSIMNRALDLQEQSLAYRRQADRLACLTQTSGQHTSIACTWLQNRQAGEKHMRIKTRGVVDNNAFFFSSGNRIGMETTVDIS
jgi:hypothetical protein